MLRGTRIIDGAEALTFRNVVEAIRGCLHRR